MVVDILHQQVSISREWSEYLGLCAMRWGSTLCASLDAMHCSLGVTTHVDSGVLKFGLSWSKQLVFFAMIQGSWGWRNGLGGAQHPPRTSH